MPLAAVVASAFLLSACAEAPIELTLPPEPTRPDLPPPVQFAYGSDDPLAAPTLVAATTSHVELAFSEGGSRSWDFDALLTVLTGSGEAWVSVAGKTAHGTWSKEAEASPIALTADDGSVLRLAPGNTSVELVPLEGSASFTP